jgi:hypothetical protein
VIGNAPVNVDHVQDPRLPAESPAEPHTLPPIEAGLAIMHTARVARRIAKGGPGVHPEAAAAAPALLGGAEPATIGTEAPNFRIHHPSLNTETPAIDAMSSRQYYNAKGKSLVKYNRIHLDVENLDPALRGKERDKAMAENWLQLYALHERITVKAAGKIKTLSWPSDPSDPLNSARNDLDQAKFGIRALVEMRTSDTKDNAFIDFVRDELPKFPFYTEKAYGKGPKVQIPRLVIPLPISGRQIEKPNMAQIASDLETAHNKRLSLLEEGELFNLEDRFENTQKFRDHMNIVQQLTNRRDRIVRDC